MELLTASFVGERLANLNAKMLKSAEKLDGIINEYELPKNRKKMYLTISALYFLSYIRASQQESIRFQPAVIAKISHSLSVSLVTGYLDQDPGQNPEVLIEELNNLTMRFMKVWDSNINKEPSPHWYIGKEAAFFLQENKTTPSPALVNLFSELFSTYTITIKDFLDEVQKRFRVEE
jgi:hypothetical protein